MRVEYYFIRIRYIMSDNDFYNVSAASTPLLGKKPGISSIDDLSKSNLMWSPTNDANDAKDANYYNQFPIVCAKYTDTSVIKDVKEIRYLGIRNNSCDMENPKPTEVYKQTKKHM